MIRKLSARLRTRKSSPRYSRLEGDLSAYEVVFRRRMDQTKSKEQEWAKKATELLQQTRHFLENERRIDEAWKSFHAAKRLEYFGMNEEERRNQGDALKQETEKMNEWRKNSILAILQASGNKAPSAEALTNAARIKDEHYHNIYYKNRITRRLFTTLFTMLLITLGLIFIFVFYCQNDGNCSFTGSFSCHNYLLGVVLFGLLGAITSSILFTRRRSGSTGIVEIAQNNVITLSKLFVAAGFSVFIFLLLRSSLADGIDILKETIKTPVDYFTVAFISGFSERYAERTIDRFVNKKKDENDAEDAD